MASADSGKYALIDDLAAEFAARYRKGERPSLKEYIDRYPELADEIRELFPAMVEMEQVKEDGGPAVECAAPTPLPRQIGDYRIVREVGRGGMGVVYEAEQVSLGRRVALKVLPLHATKDGKALARFRREAKAAARLHHTNIVPVFEVGQDGDTCFYAMQFIHGQPLDQVVEELRRLRTESAAPKPEGGQQHQAPLRQVAHSLLTGQFRPQDLGAGTPSSERRADPATTPEGIAGYAPVPEDAPATTRTEALAVLPGQTDLSSAEVDRPHYFLSVARVGQQAAQALAYAHARGVVHRDVKPSNLLLDGSGVIWVTDFGLAKTEDDNLTNPGDLVGTFRYMAPERFRGEGDGRADVYALGLTLYELLVLRPAFEAGDRARLIEQVRNDEPPRPRQIDPRIPGDLETIVLKAIDKDPARRYPTAEALAEELRRFLDDEPIKARRLSALERLGRWCRRNKAVAALAGVIAASLLTLTLGSLWFAARVDGQRRRAEGAERVALERAYKGHVEQANAGRFSRRQGQRFESLKAIQEAVRLTEQLDLAAEELQKRRDELRNLAVACLALPDVRVAADWEGWPEGSYSVDIDDAVRLYARADKEGNVTVRRVADDTEVAVWKGDGQPTTITFGPEGRFLLFVRGPQVQAWRPGEQTSVPLVKEQNPIGAVRISPDGGRLAVACQDGAINVYHLPDARPLRSLRVTPAAADVLEFSPDGRLLATVGGVYGHPARRRVLVFPLEEAGGPAELAHDDSVAAVAWYADGKTLAVGCMGTTALHVWDVPGRKVLEVNRQQKGGAPTFRVNRTGDVLASTANWWGGTRLLHTQTGRELLRVLDSHDYFGQATADGRLISLNRSGNRIRLLECVPGHERRTLVRDLRAGKGDQLFIPSLSPDEQLLAVGADTGVGLWDPATGLEVAFLPVGYTESVAFEPSGALLTYGFEGLLRWPVRPDPARPGSFHVGPPRRLLPVASWDWRIGLSKDGGVLAAATGDGAVVLHADRPGRLVRLHPHTDARRIAVSPDGRYVATSSHGDHGVKVWDSGTGAAVVHLWPADRLGEVTFSPDGRWLVAGGRWFEVGSWEEGKGVPGVDMRWCFFSPDGRWLVGYGGSGTIRLVDAVAGRPLAVLEGQEQGRCPFMTFNRDGTRLIASDMDGLAVHVWDLRAIRRQLADLGLDWDAPAYPPAAAERQPGPAEPALPAGRLRRQRAQVRVNLGDLEDDRVLGNRPTAEHLRNVVGVNSLVLAFNAFNFKAYRQRGRAYGRLNEPRSAIADYSMALTLMPADDLNRVDLLSRRAGNYLTLGEHDKAIADVREAERLDPAHGPWLRATHVGLLLQQANAAARGKDHAAALRALRTAVRLDPGHAEAHNNLAWQLLAGPKDQRDPEEALPLARKAVALAPQPIYHNTLGVALYRSGLFAEAVPVLEKSLEAGQGQTDAFDLFSLAICHHRLGDAAKAKDCYERAVRWFQERRDKLSVGWAEELTAFQAEADAALAP